MGFSGRLRGFLGAIDILRSMSKPKIARLADHLGYWHNRFGRRVDQHLEQRLAEDADVTICQWYVLVLLYHREAESVPQLAAALPIDQAAASRLVARLEFKRLVARKADRSDTTAFKLKLTRKGRQLTSELAAAAAEHDRACFGALSAGEIVQYKSLLAKLLEAHDVAPERGWIEAPLR